MQMVFNGQIVTVPAVVGNLSIGDKGCDPSQLWPYGYLTPPPPPAPGFVRVATAYVDSGDHQNAVPYPPDISQADYDAQQQAAANAAAIAQTEANYAALAASLPQRQAIAGYMQFYATATNALCSLAGITPPVNVFALGQIQQIMQSLATTPNAAIAAIYAEDLIECERKLLDNGSSLDAIPTYGTPITIPQQ